MPPVGGGREGSGRRSWERQGGRGGEVKEGNNNISAYWLLLFANYMYLGEHALESSSAYGRGLELGGRRGLHLGVVR